MLTVRFPSLVSPLVSLVLCVALGSASIGELYALPTDDPTLDRASRVLSSGSSATLKTSNHAASDADSTGPEAFYPNARGDEKVYDFKLPPMTGFQQLAGAKPMKEMLKKLITADVPVMYQTMMMVENGAATGFIGSMNTVGSLLSNTMQATQLQMEVFDSLNQPEKRFTYMMDAYKSLQGPNKDIWPAALYWASGDRPDQTPVPFNTFESNPSKTGSGPRQLLGPNGAGATGSGTSEDNSPPGSSAGNTAGGGNQSALLSAALFSRENNQFPAGSESAADELKTAMLDWVGDFEWSSEATSDHTDLTTAKFTPARKYDPAAGPQPDGIASAFERLRIDTRKQIWEHFNKVMKAYCNFKKENPNIEAPIFNKQKPSEFIQQNAMESWKIIHSLDIRPSINLVDQLFKLFVSRRNISEVNCESFKGDETDMPELDKESIDDQEAGAATEGGTTFDSCDVSPKTCLRNVVMFRITMFIVESQINHYYRWLFERLYGYTHNNPHLEVSLSTLFCSNLQLGIPCEPGHEFSTQIEDNRLRWIQFANKLSRFAQGQGGSSVFRPAASNNPIGAAGAVAASGSGGGGS